jgi:hypothetical protein
MAYASWSVTFGEQPSASKWNILGTNDASFNDGTGIAVSAITPEKLLTGTGTSWAWTSWTPTFTNLTVGSGTHASKYKQHGKTVFFRLVFTLAGDSSVGSDPQFSLPVTAVSHSAATVVARAMFQDTGTKQYFGDVYLNSTTTAKFLRNITDTTDLYSAVVNASNPHTWATTDIITATGSYEAA